MINRLLLSLFLFSMSSSAYAQQHNASHEYVVPTDPDVQKKLAAWQDIKFGLMMHWGTYSQWGVVESWSICPEDEGWTQRRGPYSADWYTYLKAYENLQTTFNPTHFNPEKWADAAKDAGMQYVVFTTKHHDGFCMFDTKQTDYKITDKKSPFSSNPRANVTKEVMNAFREKGFMTGTYFSKPDWHSNDYWWRYFPPKDRNVSYDPKKYPERWQAFKNYTYNQIEELMTGYGKVDILWLDGGWVRPKETIDTSVEWQRTITHNQDIDMARIAAMGRQHQPGLLVVDRTVTGQFENYVTPEQQIPSSYLPYPWESCITMGNSWSYVPNDEYKSASKIIHMLTDIVSKGGNLLLNIGPSPDGDWDPNAYARLQEIGGWMKVNGEAIYGTRGDSLYGKQGNFVFTHKPDALYAIYQLGDNETQLPAEIILPKLTLSKRQTVKLLGFKSAIPIKQEGGETRLKIPAAARKAQSAAVFRIN
ncbi:MAG TPA: alpha-L-fucosidase [Flavitalea sp.]|nr:alpha-L-fucosidase [Flavitalea sp.]